MAEEDFGAHYESDDNEKRNEEGIDGVEHDRGDYDEEENVELEGDVVHELGSNHVVGYEPEEFEPQHEEDGVTDESETIHDATANGDFTEQSVVEHDEPLEDSQHAPTTTDSGNVTSGDEINKWPGWPGESVFRMLVPVHKVGGLIGRKGESIKKLTEETRARIKVLDGPPGTSERAVMVSAKEEPGAVISPAMEGLLRVHKEIIGLDDDSSQDKSGVRESAVTRLLVADGQSRNLIGKQGSTIKSIQDSSGCTIRIIRERLPLFALRDDTVVEVQGPPAGVHKAVESISNHLRKFLVDRGIVAVFETEMQAWSRSNQNMRPQESWGLPQGFNNSTGHGFEASPGYFQQPNQYDNYYLPSNVPRFDKQQGRDPIYSRDASVGHAHAQPPVTTKLTNQMQIPTAYADTIIGTSGANISYIRRASGAAIAVQETIGMPDQMTVEISGSASQIQAAEQLIQNFIAEASSATMQNPTDASTNQTYNTYAGISGGYALYQAEPTAYSSQPSEASTTAGDYSSMYMTNYGYQ